MSSCLKLIPGPERQYLYYAPADLIEIFIFPNPIAIAETSLLTRIHKREPNRSSISLSTAREFTP